VKKSVTKGLTSWPENEWKIVVSSRDLRTQNTKNALAVGAVLQTPLRELAALCRSPRELWVGEGRQGVREEKQKDGKEWNPTKCERN